MNLPTAEQLYESLESAHPSKAIAIIEEFEALVRAHERHNTLIELGVKNPDPPELPELEPEESP